METIDCLRTASLILFGSRWQQPCSEWLGAAHPRGARTVDPTNISQWHGGGPVPGWVSIVLSGAIERQAALLEERAEALGNGGELSSQQIQWLGEIGYGPQWPSLLSADARRLLPYHRPRVNERSLALYTCRAKTASDGVMDVIQIVIEAREQQLRLNAAELRRLAAAHDVGRGENRVAA